MIYSVTGHRPPRVGGYGLPNYERLTRFATKVLSDLPAKPELVQTGMALGWDQAIAFACYRLGIPYLAAVPFEGQERLWQEPDRVWYHKLLSKAQKVVTVSPGGYDPMKMLARDRWMVDNSDRLLALWDGENTGGTFQTWLYARGVKLPAANLWDAWVEFAAAHPLPQ